MSELIRSEPPRQTQVDQQVDRLFVGHFSDPRAPRPDEVRRLVGELEQRRSELEVQNRDLLEARQQLQAYRDRYVDLYDSAPLGYVTFDQDGYVQEINLAGAGMLGCQRDELTGYAFADHVAQRDRESFLQQVRDCCGQRQVVTSELGLVARDGRQIVVQLHMVPIEAPQQDGSFCKTAVTDITARKRAEESLQQERNLLRTLIDNLPDFVYVKDAQGRFVAANRAAARIMGAATPGDLIGKTDADFYPAELAAEYRRDEQRMAGTGEPLVGKDEPHVDAAGKRRAILTTKVPLKDSQGRVVGLVGVSRDVTDRKRVEEELRLLNRTLEERVAQRTEEAGRRTAELRGLACELIQAEDRQRRRLAQALHDGLQQLLVASRMKIGRLRLRATEPTLAEKLAEVEQILDESISESRSLTLELSPPVLHEAGLAGALQWLAQQMEKQHGLSVGVQIDPAAEPGDEASRVFLFQAVRELLFNVVKHAQAASAQVCLTRGEGTTIRVDVGDDGIGVDLVRQAWGFGLATVHERLELLGGRMEMHASPGRGTEVSIFVPQRQAAAAKQGELPV